MLKSLSEKHDTEGYYLVCKIYTEVFYCAPDGDATFRRDEAKVFEKSDLNELLIAHFAQDVSEYVTISSAAVRNKVRLVPVSKIKEAYVNEDFGMGVGAPVGADQGIPYGGDGKAVVPCYMGMVSRHGTVNKATGFGNILWPKRKKKRLKRRYPNFVQESLEDDNLTPVNIASFLEDEGLDETVYRIEETDDNTIVITLNADPVTSNAVQDVNNLFSQFYADYNSSEVIIILIDRLAQTASIRIGDEDAISGMACASMTDFETVWETFNNLTEQ